MGKRSPSLDSGTAQRLREDGKESERGIAVGARASRRLRRKFWTSVAGASLLCMRGARHFFWGFTMRLV
jgi:hypothetical protein